MLDIRNLYKNFGPLVAVDDVSFTVKQGEVLGFLGPNGAGKSTTMKKMATGFLAPISGTSDSPAVTTSAPTRSPPSVSSAICPRAPPLTRT